MGTAELKYFETEYSQTSVKFVSLFVVPPAGLFHLFNLESDVKR